MKRVGGLLAAVLVLSVAACGDSSTSGVDGQGPAGANTAPTPCGGSSAWPPTGYTAALPTGVEVTSTGPLGARVANSTGATIHVRVATWGLGSCTGWGMFTPEQTADIVAHSSSDFALEDPASGIPFRVAVEVWSAACPDACSDSPSGFWSGPLTEATPIP
jgi:hypothetical protein